MTYRIFFYHSDTLGLVPIWGQAHGGLAKSIHDKLKVSKEEHGILYGAYREDNPNSEWK